MSDNEGSTIVSSISAGETTHTSDKQTRIKKSKEDEIVGKTAYDLLEEVGRLELSPMLKDVNKQVLKKMPRSASAGVPSGRKRKGSIMKSKSVDHSLSVLSICLLPLEELPELIIIKIFSFLSRGQLANKIAKVNKAWRRWAYHPNLWTSIDLSELKKYNEVDNGDIVLINTLYKIATRGAILEQKNMLTRVHPDDNPVYCRYVIPTASPYKANGFFSQTTTRREKPNELDVALINDNLQHYQNMEKPKIFDETERNKCNSVKSITTCYSWPISSYGAYYIAHTCPNLESLQIEPFFHHIGQKAFVELFSACTQIESLKLSSNRSSISKVVFDVMTQNLSNSLRELSTISFENGQYISRLNRLEVLNLEGATSITDAFIIMLVNCPYLRVLNLKGTQVTDEAIDFLSKHLHHLEVIDLSQTKATDDAVGSLAKGVTNKIQFLSVSGLLVSDDSAKHIANGGFAKSIKTLQFIYTQVTQKGAKILAANCPSLEKVVIV